MKTTKQKNKSNNIYFISHDHPDQHHLIKIGTAKYFNQRVGNYLTSFPFGIRIHLLLPDWHDNTEGYWLSCFNTHLIDGEWHDFDEEAMDVMKLIAQWVHFKPFSLARAGAESTALRSYRKHGLGTDYRADAAPPASC